MKHILVFFLFFTVFVSCQKKETKNEQPSPKTSALKPSELYSKVYYISTSLNTEQCIAQNEGCDCCDGKIVFLEGNRFISDFYCIPEEEFTSGSFEIKGDKLLLRYDEYQAIMGPVNENDPDSKDTLRVESNKCTTLELSLFTCKKKILFKSGSDYYSEDHKTKFSDAIADYKKSGVWNLLEGED